MCLLGLSADRDELGTQDTKGDVRVPSNSGSQTDQEELDTQDTGFSFLSGKQHRACHSVSEGGRGATTDLFGKGTTEMTCHERAYQRCWDIMTLHGLYLLFFAVCGIADQLSATIRFDNRWDRVALGAGLVIRKDIRLVGPKDAGRVGGRAAQS